MRRQAVTDTIVGSSTVVLRDVRPSIGPSRSRSSKLNAPRTSLVTARK